MANPGAIIFSNDPRKGTRNIAWQMLKRVTSYYVIPLSLATDCFSNEPATLPRFMDTRWGSIDIYFLSLKSLRPFFPAWARLLFHLKRKCSDKKYGISFFFVWKH